MSTWPPGSSGLLRGSGDRDQAQSLLAEIKDPDSLDAALRARLRSAGILHFSGEYQRLADAYIPPWPVFERVQLDRFTGREWLVQKVDAFLAAHDRGVFVLEAEAGLGKTAFLAHLAKERGYVSHFVELAAAATALRRALRTWRLN